MAKPNSTVEVIRFGDINKAVIEGNDRSLLEVAVATVAQCKSLANFSQGYQTGQLKNSYMWKVSDGEEGGFNTDAGKQAVNKLEGKPDNQVAWVGSASDHAGPIEFGTKRMSAQPVIRPAVDLVVKKKVPQEVIEFYESEAVREEVRSGRKIVKF